ncbi:MAG: BlaI/MecI/CopY family transcriptional regulator [Lachnospiraceae bacterium]|nr:BlaI/MecI/CopY family transcriptional regulator [Lachnospiraceae bacterium]
MSNKIQKLPDSELDIMLVLWKHRPPMSRLEIEQIVNEKKALAPTTILSLLTRLEKKNYVSVTKQGKMNLYTPLISQEEYQSSESRNILEKLYGNSLKKFVTSLYHGKKMDEASIQELDRFLRNLEEESER